MPVPAGKEAVNFSSTGILVATTCWSVTRRRVRRVCPLVDEMLVKLGRGHSIHIFGPAGFLFVDVVYGSTIHLFLHTRDPGDVLS